VSGIARAATARAPGSWRDVLRGRHALSTAVVVLNVLAPAVNWFITSTVLPSAIAEIGGLAFYAWASTAYAVTSIIGSAGGSVTIRKIGARAALLVAAGIFAAGTATCASAGSMPVMVAGRAIQGLGAGMMISGVYAVVRELFPEALWPRVLATISGAWGIAAMAGPAVGGIFADRGVWRAAFWTMVPIALLTAGLSAWMLRRVERQPPAAGMPFGRLLLICAAVLCVGMVANTRSAALQAALAAGALATVALALHLDRQAPLRLFPTGMLSLRATIGGGFWMIFLLAIATAPGAAFLPLLLQLVHGTPPATAGYLYAVQSFSWTSAAIIGARLERRQVRMAIVVGPLVVAVGFAALAATIGPGPVAAVGVSMMMIGAGIGACWAHLSNLILAAGRPDEAAVTASVVPTTQLFAVAFGAAMSGVIANAAGLSTGASGPVAAAAGAALYGSFIVPPLAAAVIALRLRSVVQAS
jgi:MFS family permease